MQKKTLAIVIIAVIILIAIAFAINFFFLSGPREKGEGSIIQDFFPFGSSGEEQIPFADSGSGQDGGTGFSGFAEDRLNDFGGAQGSVFKLSEISPTAISGAVIFANENSDAVIRHIERETGHIFETDVASGITNRISNVTIPKIQEARWLPDGNSVVIRYINEKSNAVESFYAELAESSDANEQPLDGVFLSTNIHDLSVSPNGSRIFYIVGPPNNVSGIIADPDGSTPTTVFKSALTEWLVSWVRDDRIALTTKASERVPGFLVFLNPKTGSERRILGPINGLTTNTSPNGEYVLFSRSEKGKFSLSVYDVSENTSTKLIVDTFPEKCVWSPVEPTIAYCAVPNLIINGNYPDVWYQGIVGFTDRVWKIDVSTKTVSLIIDPRIVARQELDIINPLLSPDAQTLIFMNKKDSSLWSLQLTDTSSESIN